MSFSFFHPLLQRLLHPRWPLLLYAATWTTVLTVTVAVASFTPELAFLYSAVSPSSDQVCSQPGTVRLPLDVPSDLFCFPGRLFKRSRFDVLVPPVFAGVIVAGSACVIKAMGLWEADDQQLLKLIDGQINFVTKNPECRAYCSRCSHVGRTQLRWLREFSVDRTQSRWLREFRSSTCSQPTTNKLRESRSTQPTTNKLRESRSTWSSAS